MNRFSFLLFILVGISFTTSTFGQVEGGNVKVISDTIQPKPVRFTPDAATEFIKGIVARESLWREKDNNLRLSLVKLINYYNEPFDSVKTRLNRFPFSTTEIISKTIAQSDTLPIRWLNNSSFIVDTVVLEKNPIIQNKTIVMRILDPSVLPLFDSVPELRMYIDSLFQAKDTLIETSIDYTYLKSKNIQVYKVVNDTVYPPIVVPKRYDSAKLLANSSKLVFTRNSQVLVAQNKSPFYIVPSQKMPDSLKLAVETLISYTIKRDSVLLQVSDLVGRKTPIWLSTGKEDYYRYWVKNSKNDSITVWIGNPSRLSISLALEEDVNVERKAKQLANDIPITLAKPSRIMAKVKPLKEIPIYWNKEINSSFSLNQNYLSNWAKGGESSLASLFDISGRADYSNKEAKTKWTNSGRLRFGTTRTKQNGFRTNTDIIEANSQFNKVLIDKLDFSSILYFKTQVAKGFNYPNDSVVVSKFLNPGSFTIGVGAEYKPNKNTGINFSLLSFRSTFVLDTARINQTAHGIEKDKRVRNEMGGQLVVKNKLTVLKDMEITNSLRLFSNYLNKPQNIDVDWEMGLEKHISWYFKIRLNLHLIYDDDIRFPMLDANDQPILLPNGSPKKVAKAQFNQLLGLTLSFKI
jgi:hypothetical protein